jgi:hypothetical protein
MTREKNPREHYLIRDCILFREGYKSYDDFLKSEYWKNVKLKTKLPKYMDNYNSCCICKATNNLVLHHENYRWLLTKFELRAVRCLCKDCHEDLHRIAYEKDISFYQAYQIMKPSPVLI